MRGGTISYFSSLIIPVSVKRIVFKEGAPQRRRKTRSVNNRFVAFCFLCSLLYKHRKSCKGALIVEHIFIVKDICIVCSVCIICTVCTVYIVCIGCPLSSLSVLSVLHCRDCLRCQHCLHCDNSAWSARSAFFFVKSCIDLTCFVLYCFRFG